MEWSFKTQEILQGTVSLPFKFLFKFITHKDVLKETMSEYTQASSLHGVQHIFENGRSLKASRITWLGLAIAATVLGIVWSVEVVSFVLLGAIKVF